MRSGRMSVRCSDSVIPNQVATMHPSANTAWNTKMPRQLATTSIQPPSRGARMGAAPITSIRVDSARAEACGSSRSRITARETTMPTPPPSAWTSRHIVSWSTLADIAQPTVPTT